MGWKASHRRNLPPVLGSALAAVTIAYDSRVMRQLLSLLATAAACYGALLALLYVFQSRMLYLPHIGGTGLAGKPADIGLAFEEVRLTTDDGVSLHGWFVPASGPGGAPRRVVLHVHGNGGNISHRLDLIRVLHGLGVDVLLFDYRGYGRSEGHPSEDGTYRDARAAWDYLVERRGYAPGEIVLFGHSLGAAVAAELARHVRPAGIILESPFTSIADVASHHYWFVPARLLVRFRYATVEYVRDARAPVLVVHSRVDEVVPFEHGLEVFRNAPEPKEFLEIEGDHNEGFLRSGALYSQGLRRFIERLGSV